MNRVPPEKRDGPAERLPKNRYGTDKRTRENNGKNSPQMHHDTKLHNSREISGISGELSNVGTTTMEEIESIPSRMSESHSELQLSIPFNDIQAVAKLLDHDTSR